MRGLPNVMLTPHIGGSTLEAQESIGREVASSLTKFTNTGATTGAVNFPQLELAPLEGTHRVLNVHKNVPGVLRDINKLVSDRNANVLGQILATDPRHRLPGDGSRQGRRERRTEGDRRAELVDQDAHPLLSAPRHRQNASPASARR